MFHAVKEKRAIAAATIGILLIGSASTWSYLREHAPIFVTGWDVDDPVKAGDPEAAMAHSRKLLALLKRNNWDPTPIPFKLWMLPDRKFAEDPFLRKDYVSSYAVMRPDQPAHGFEDVAFTCSIYARQNTKQYKGGMSRSNPSGFIIVGFKNGNVVKVKQEDVRLVKRPDDDMVVWTYPGMKIYNPNAPKLPYIQDSAPEQPALLASAVSLVSVPKPKPTPCTSTKAAPDVPCGKQ